MAVLGGSWVVVSGVTSPLIWATIIRTTYIPTYNYPQTLNPIILYPNPKPFRALTGTPLTTTHEAPSSNCSNSARRKQSTSTAAAS